MNMELLKYFNASKGQFDFLTLKDEKWTEFVTILPSGFRDCYIQEEELQHRMKTFSSSKENEFSEILPTLGNIKSGDFGEILSYFLIKERYKKQKIDGPQKWRWKQEKNVAAPYSDVILFTKKIEKPSKDDLLISVESKMKATLKKKYHPIQKAIDGAEKDYVSRMAHSLSWLRKKYKEESLKVNAPVEQLKEYVAILERFIKSEIFGEYKKYIKAVAIVDKSFLSDEVKKKIAMPSLSGTDLEIMIVSIKDLKRTYETIFTNIPKL